LTKEVKNDIFRRRKIPHELQANHLYHRLECPATQVLMQECLKVPGTHQGIKPVETKSSFPSKSPHCQQTSLYPLFIDRPMHHTEYN
jgi:hypothetical protein